MRMLNDILSFGLATIIWHLTNVGQCLWDTFSQELQYNSLALPYTIFVLFSLLCLFDTVSLAYCRDGRVLR